jgi:triacylglycerol lipase
MQRRNLLKTVRMLLPIALLCLSTALPASDRDAVNFSELRAQAVFADAAYRSEVAIRGLLEPDGYDLTLYHTIPDIQIAFFLATNESTETQVISIRGTSNIENAMLDVSLKLRVDPASSVSMHQGFAYSAHQVYAELKPLLKPEYKIKVTGHSLGGAIALILAMFMDLDQFNVDQVVTFGQPKVTNIPGAKKIQHLNVIRVVDPHDLVPLVPLFDPLDINNIDVYWHAGKEVVLLDGNRYALLEGVDSMLRATKFTQRRLSEENLRNHQMAAYLNRVEARVKTSELVPYKTTLNLFNLFGSE